MNVFAPQHGFFVVGALCPTQITTSPAEEASARRSDGCIIVGVANESLAMLLIARLLAVIACVYPMFNDVAPVIFAC